MSSKNINRERKKYFGREERVGGRGVEEGLTRFRGERFGKIRSIQRRMRVEIRVLMVGVGGGGRG